MGGSIDYGEILRRERASTVPQYAPIKLTQLGEEEPGDRYHCHCEPHRGVAISWYNVLSRSNVNKEIVTAISSFTASNIEPLYQEIATSLCSSQ